jgi:hypothetical protein
MSSRPLPVRTLLSVGLLGSAVTLVLQPNPVVSVIALGILVACALAVVVRALRRASRRIDRIFSDELKSGEEITDEDETVRAA